MKEVNWDQGTFKMVYWDQAELKEVHSDQGTFKKVYWDQGGL